MKRQFDWVPWFAYSASQATIVGGTTTGQFPMLDIAGTMFSTTDTIGEIEDTGRFFLHRIVGDLELSSDQTDQGADVVILPGLVEQTGGNSIQTIIGAGSPAGGIWTDEFSNNEFWHHRHYPIQLLNNGIPGVGTDNPWWSHIDIKPKRVIQKGMNPVLAFCNQSAGNLNVRFMLRALVTRL